MIPLYYEVGPFPPEPIRVYRVVGCESDEQKRAVDYLLGKFFVLLEDGWYQPRAETVKAQSAEIHMQAVERGKRSVVVRREKYGSAQPINRNSLESVSKRSRKRSRNAPELTTTTTTTITTKEKDKEDASASVWDFGIDLLTREGGLNAKTARSYIGMLCKQWSEATVLDALMAAAGKADPKAYMRKWIDGQPKKGKKADSLDDVIRQLQAEGK